MDTPNPQSQPNPSESPGPFGVPMPHQPQPQPSQSAPPQPISRDPISADSINPHQPNGGQAAQFGTQPQSVSQPQPTDQPQQPADDAASGDQYYDQNLIPGIEKPMPEEVLFEWHAPSRPFKQRNRQYFTTIGLICGLIGLILFFAGQLLPVAVIAAVFFAYYVLNSTPPGEITHKVTTYGIRVEDTLYFWEEMGRFWFSEKFGSTILHIEIARFPNRLNLLLGTINKEDMKLFLSEVLLNQEPPPTTYEKAAKWLYQKLPLDIES